MDLGKATLQVTVDASGARSGVNDAVRAFDILKRKGQETINGIGGYFESLKDKIFSIKGLLAGIGVFELAKSFIEAGRQTEIFTDRLQVLLGSVKEGNKLFAEMQQFALKSPFQYKDVMESATTLAAVLKGGVGEIKAWMPLISDLAVAAGLGIQETTGQIVKMLSAGAGAADMFRERGILAMLGFQQKTQYTAQQTREMLIKAFTDPSSKFRDASIAMMSTWEGVTSNMADQWFQFQQKVMIQGGVLNYLKAIAATLQDEFVQSFGQGTDAAKNFADFLIQGFKAGVKAVAGLLQALKLLGVGIDVIKESYKGLVAYWYGADADILGKQFEENTEKLKAYKQQLDDMKANQPKTGVTDQFIADAQKKYNDALKESSDLYAKYTDAQKKADSASQDNDKSMQALLDTVTKFNEGAGPEFDKFLADVQKHFDEYNEKTANGYKKTADFQSELGKYAAQAGLTAKQQRQLNNAFDEGVGIVSNLDDHIMGAAGDLSGTDKIWSDYGKNIADIVKEWEKYSQNAKLLQSLGFSEQMMREKVTQAVIAEGKARDANIAAREKELNLIGKANEDLDKEFATLNMTDREKAMHDAAQKVIDDWDKLSQKEKELHPLSQQGLEDLKNRTGALYDESQAIQNTRDQRNQYISGWVNMLGSMADDASKFFTRQIRSWKDFWHSLLDDATNFVSQILSQIFKLAVVNPIINSMFGGSSGFNLLPTLASSGGFSGIFGMGGSTGAAASGGGGSGVVNQAMGLYDAGGKIWNGFKNGFTGFFGQPSATSYSGFLGNYTGAQYAGAPVSGYADEMGLVPDYGATVPGSPGVAPGSYTYSPSGWVQGAGIAGGIYAGYNRFQASNKDFGGAAGAAAYGYGTYAATIGAGAAMSGGLAAGFAAIPVVGWIALAAMLIDTVSGGKLFGTAGKLIGGASNLAVSSSGGSLSQWYTTKGQKAFFGGATFKEHDIANTDAQNDAATSFYEAIMNQATPFARLWGQKIGDGLVGGVFQQRYDKHGNLTGSTTTINGRSFEGENQQQFAERLYAANQQDIMKKAGIDVSKFTDQFIESADAWAQAMQSASDMLQQVKADVGSGQYLLDAASSLQDVFDIVDKYATGGQDIMAVYQDLMKDTQGLRDILQGLHIDLGKSGADFVDFAKQVGDAVGGGDNAAALYASFEQHYMTPDEIQRKTNASLQIGATSMVDALGDAGKGLNFSNFRERFEKALPTLTPEQVAQWLQAGDALAKLADAIGNASMATTDLNEALQGYKDIQDHVNDDLASVQYTATDALNANYKQVMDIASAYDGSAASQAQLLAAVDQRYTMEMAYLRKIRDITQAINDSIGGTIEDIKTSTMGNSSKYKYYKEQAEALAKDLATMTDPDQINATVQKIQMYESQAWGLLTPQQQKLMADSFIKFLTGVQDEADRQLGVATDNVTTQNDSISKAVETAFKTVGQTQQTAADTQVTAANTNLDAANTFANTEIRVVVVDNRSEVGGSGTGGRYVQ